MDIKDRTELSMNRKTRGAFVGMVFFTIAFAILTLVFFILYAHFQKGWMLSVAITMLTIFYHFAMRLTVGETVSHLFRDKEFPQDKLGFGLHDFEKKLYRHLKVKNWKASVITAKPEQFDLQQVSPKELLHNVMQAELVHRIIMVLSFVPLLFIIPFGVPLVFILTSVGACITDCVFVIIQRYNRPRVIRYVELMERRSSRIL